MKKTILVILLFLVQISFAQELKIKIRSIPVFMGIFYEHAAAVEYQFNNRYAANIAYQFHWEIGEGTSYRHNRLYFSGRIYTISEKYLFNKVYTEPFYRYSHTLCEYEVGDSETFIFHSPGISFGKQFDIGRRWVTDLSIGGYFLNDEHWNKDRSDFTLIYQRAGPIFWRFDFKVGLKIFTKSRKKPYE